MQTTSKQPQAAASAPAETAPAPRVLDASELAAATGGGGVLGSRTGVMIGSAARTGIVIVV